MPEHDIRRIFHIEVHSSGIDSRCLFFASMQESVQIRTAGRFLWGEYLNRSLAVSDHIKVDHDHVISGCGAVVIQIMGNKEYRPILRMIVVITCFQAGITAESVGKRVEISAMVGDPDIFLLDPDHIQDLQCMKAMFEKQYNPSFI